jgi:transposase
MIISGCAPNEGCTTLRAMAKTYRPYVPEQDLLLPPSLRDWLPENHLAFFVSDLIDQLDLSAITNEYEDEARGYPPYHPVMLTKVLVYGYCVGAFSSRKIQRRLVEDVAFRVLAAGNEPDFRTIADFRQSHLPALKGFFEQVLRLACELGAPRVGRVALDSSKVKANASKHKAMSYGRMREKQQQLREEVQQLLDQAEAADAAEDAEYGPDRHGDELPAELQRRESRLKRIREAKRALEVRAKDEAAAAGKPAESAKPDSKAQYNFTDPESRIMKAPDGFVQAYNVQVAVDELQLIVGQAVTQETNDKKQLMAMITAIAPPDHSTISRTRRLIDLETHEAVFTWMLQQLADAGLVAQCCQQFLRVLLFTALLQKAGQQSRSQRVQRLPAESLLRPFTHLGEVPLTKVGKSDQGVGRNVPLVELERLVCFDNRAYIHFREKEYTQVSAAAQHVQRVLCNHLLHLLESFLESSQRRKIERSVHMVNCRRDRFGSPRQLEPFVSFFPVVVMLRRKSASPLVFQR